MCPLTRRHSRARANGQTINPVSTRSASATPPIGSCNPADGRWDLELDAEDWLSPAMEDFTAPDGDVRVSVWSVPTTVSGFAPYADLEAWIADYCQKRGSPTCNGALDEPVELCVEIRDCHPGLLVASDQLGSTGVLPVRRTDGRCHRLAGRK